MIKEVIKELNELQEYKQKYESAVKDKQRMSELLFELMTREYEITPYEDRSKSYQKSVCHCCRNRDCCILKGNLPEDINKPIESDCNWIPARKDCGNFQWS